MFRGKKTIGVCFVLLQLLCGGIWASPTTKHQAERAVAGWLKADSTPLGMALGGEVAKVDAHNSSDGQVIYYIVYLKPNGFVIVSADDLIEPIIAFVAEGTFDPSPGNPLGALVTNDLRGRTAAVRKTSVKQPAGTDSQRKWSRLLSLADTNKAEAAGTCDTEKGMASVDDIRVAPLIQSKWWQWTCCEAPQLACYNYYTPRVVDANVVWEPGNPENYVCGCYALAAAQVMRYHEFPTEGIGIHQYGIRVDHMGQTVYTRGGDGAGGPYNWSDMALVPDCNTSETQRQAIGALCYDAGVVLRLRYTYSATWSDTLEINTALTTVFQYGNAALGYDGHSDIGAALIPMINPNLDDKEPVILMIEPGPGGHAIVCDGYGYNLMTLYHHVNMGWGGNYDGWYNLPTIEMDSYPPYTRVIGCVYNIHVAGGGEMVSGRVLDSHGDPLADANVVARAGEVIAAQTKTDSKGIYAFDSLESNTTYTVVPQVRWYGFQGKEVSTGASVNYAAVSGNVWGVDFIGLQGDFDCNGVVNFKDLAKLAQDGPKGDSAPRALYKQATDFRDVAAVADNWLTAITIPPLPSQAGSPSPADLATEIDVDADLSWTPGSDALSHDVYFGKTHPPAFVCNQTETIFDCGTLDKGPTYYWRIDEINGWGKTKGAVWSFTTVWPQEAWGPSPADGEDLVSADPTCTWHLGDLDTTGYTLSYNVYCGTDAAAVAAIATGNTTAPQYKGNVTTETIVLAALHPETEYFWRVDTKLKRNLPPFPITYTKGQVWCFTTGP